MDGLAAGQLEAQPQQGEATYAPKISTAQARVEWSQPAFAIDRHIRAHTPGPGAWTMWDEARVKVGPVSPVEAAAAVPEHLEPGQLYIAKNAVFVGTATQPVQLGKIQPPGKKMMNAADWARGLGKDAEVKFQ